MGRGRGTGTPSDYSGLQRKRGRRAGDRRAEAARRSRVRALERRHIRSFFSVAVKVARGMAREAGVKVAVDRTDEAKARSSFFTWTRAMIKLPPSDVSVHFIRGGKEVSGTPEAIHVYLGRKHFRTCPIMHVQSGDGRAFSEWLGECLRLAFDRRRDGEDTS